MSAQSLAYGLPVAAVMFAIGLIGVMSRRNIFFVLMSIEVMLNAANIAFVTGGAKWGAPDGQVMALFVLAVASAEVSVGLALVLQVRKRLKTLDTDAMDRMRG